MIDRLPFLLEVNGINFYSYFSLNLYSFLHIQSAKKKKIKIVESGNEEKNKNDETDKEVKEFLVKIKVVRGYIETIQKNTNFLIKYKIELPNAIAENEKSIL